MKSISFFWIYFMLCRTKVTLWPYHLTIAALKFKYWLKHMKSISFFLIYFMMCRTKFTLWPYHIFLTSPDKLWHVDDMQILIPVFDKSYLLKKCTQCYTCLDCTVCYSPRCEIIRYMIKTTIYNTITQCVAILSILCLSDSWVFFILHTPCLRLIGKITV